MKELIARYSDNWKDKEGGIYSLAQGVVYWKPPVSTTTAIQEALIAESASDLHCYGPDEGLDALRERLVDKIRTVNGLDDQHDVMVTAGANQAYMNCVLTLLSRNDAGTTPTAVVFAPYYFNHVMALQMVVGNDNVLVGPTVEATGEPDVEWLEEQLQSKNNTIRMVTVTNPGNPTGTTISTSTCQRLVDLTAKHKAWMVWDCAYEDFVHTEGNDGTTCMGWNQPHCLHIFSFSKAYSLAGYRCGYVAVPTTAASGAVWNNMLKVQDTIPIAPSRISQYAAMGALDVGRPWIHAQVATLAPSRKAIRAALAAPYVTNVMGGSGAMYFMAELRKKGNGVVADDQAIAEALVRDFGVAIIPGSFCGAPGWIRVCYSNLHPDQCLVAAERLSNGLKSLC